jgi:carbon-monoxide dehydrogenase large subunit
MTEHRVLGKPAQERGPRLLTGQALFTDDVHLAGMVHAAFLRSPYATHACGASTSHGAGDGGRLAVYTADDLGAYWNQVPCS